MKNKKIICIIILILISISLIICGCVTNKEKKQQILNHQFIVVEENTKMFLTYDKDTKVMYIILTGVTTRNGISPYYIVQNGQAIVGIYGVNWFENKGE